MFLRVYEVHAGSAEPTIYGPFEYLFLLFGPHVMMFQTLLGLTMKERLIQPFLERHDRAMQASARGCRRLHTRVYEGDTALFPIVAP